MKTILIADDEEYLRMLVRTTLEEPHYRILDASDGAEALEIATRELPDLLVLDWMMPRLTGVEVALALKKNEATARIPFILLAARGQEADRSHGNALGAYAYLVKPFSPIELLQKVAEILD